MELMSQSVGNVVRIHPFPAGDKTTVTINVSVNGHLAFAVVGSMDE